MPLQPNPTSLYVNRLLPDVSLAYWQDNNEFIADQVLPHIPTQVQGGNYVSFPKEYWYRSTAQLRAPATESVGTGYKVDTSGTFMCKTWALHHDVPIEDYANAQDPFNVDMEATNLITRQLMLRRETVFANTFLTTGVWQGWQYSGSTVDFAPNTHGSGYWDSSSSDPIKDIDKVKKNIKQNTGFLPNTLVLGENVYMALRNNPAMLARINGGATTAAPALYADAAALARLFGVERVFVAGAIVNSAVEGATPSMNFVMANGFLLCYIPRVAGRYTPSAGYIFDWVGRNGANAFGVTMNRIEIPLKKAVRIEGESAYDMQLVGKDLGVFGTSVLQNP